MITRREFIQRTAAISGLMIGSSCNFSKKVTGSLLGPNASLGHRLHKMKFASPVSTERMNVAIVGGGISGLSAARHLHKQNRSFKLFEMEPNVGGNSRGGIKGAMKYPLGAHYLPIPSADDRELIDFLSECGVITGFERGIPVYNDYYLCFDPKERLFINHHWQEGLIPHEGVPRNDREEIARFIERMNYFRELRGSDGRKAFDIPVDNSSRDADLLRLDRETMDDFLTREGFRSPYLRWYVNYCCADDFGSRLTETSAWAGIHYFAARAGSAVNAKSDEVLTWPEGNQFLVDKLRVGTEDKIKSNALVFRVERKGSVVEVDYFDASENVTKRVIADAIIMATPQFVNARLLNRHRMLDYSQFQYAPWLVANIRLLHPLDERRGESLCWDNVIYGSAALGYVNAQHQALGVTGNSSMITYYRPLLGVDCNQARRTLFEADFDSLRDSIFDDLVVAHPHIEETVEDIEFWRWGHGMIRPQPGFIWGAARQQSQHPFDERIFFAHTDVSGISIFEEGFHAGIRSANQALQIV